CVAGLLPSWCSSSSRPDDGPAARVVAARAPDDRILTIVAAPNNRVAAVITAPHDRVTVARALDGCRLGRPLGGQRPWGSAGAVAAGARVAPDDIARVFVGIPRAPDGRVGLAVRGTDRTPRNGVAGRRRSCTPYESLCPRVRIRRELTASDEQVAPDDVPAPGVGDRLRAGQRRSEVPRKLDGPSRIQESRSLCQLV